MAILDWSHLFGCHNDPLHYRNMAIRPDDFKKEMLTTLDIDDKPWQEYWNEEGMREPAIMGTNYGHKQP